MLLLMISVIAGATLPFCTVQSLEVVESAVVAVGWVLGFPPGHWLLKRHLKGLAWALSKRH